jgi:Tfp pilus assembly protein PilF
MLTLLAAVGPRVAAGPPAASRVLVMPFAVAVEAQAPHGAGASLWLGDAAAWIVGDDLTRLGLTAVSRDECVRAFDRLQLPMSPVLTRATMIRVGELLGASEIVFGDVHLGDRLAVRVRAIRVEAGSQLPEIASDAAFEDLFPLFHRVSGSLVAAIGRAPAGRPQAETPWSLAVFENYIKGLVAATPAAQQRLLENALKQAPQDPRVLFALWGVYASLGAHEKALSAASAVPKDAPLSRRARFAAALSLIDLGRLDGAFQALTALYNERAAPVLSNALGLLQLRRPSTQATGTPVFYFTRAVEQEPDNTDYLFNLGYASALAHDEPAALLWLREAVRYEAANGDAHLVMSAVLAGAGKTVEAQRELDLARLLGTLPDSSKLVLGDKIPAGLARLRTDLDRAPAERVDATIGNPAERDQRETALFHLNLGRRLFDAQNDREATNELRRAVYLAPYEDEPHVLLGRVYQRAGRLSEAADEFKVAVWCRETAANRVALGEALLEAGDKDGARREAQRALVLQPGFAAAAALLKKAGGIPSGLLRVSSWASW